MTLHHTHPSPITGFASSSLPNAVHHEAKVPLSFFVRTGKSPTDYRCSQKRKQTDLTTFFSPNKRPALSSDLNSQHLPSPQPPFGNQLNVPSSAPK